MQIINAEVNAEDGGCFKFIFSSSVQFNFAAEWYNQINVTLDIDLLQHYG